GQGRRADLAVGFLGPDVDTRAGGAVAASGSDAFYMPGFGWISRAGRLTYGIGVYAQGGMGTEYDAATPLALGSGDPVRSEVGVGRLLFPLAFEATERLQIGGSLDVVWAGMDLRMAVSGADLGGMVSGFDPGWAPLFPALGGASWARFDFSDDSDYSGQAKGYGLAWKVGAVYQVAPTLSVGGAYHSATALDDLEGPAALSAEGGFTDSGEVAVRDFQWPATAALGVAWRPTPAWLLAADVKRIFWADVLERFRMTYISPTFGALDVEMQQDWNDQTVYQLGAAYQLTSALILRAGVNLSDNPIPDAWVHPLFPAIIEDHYALGLGYRFAGGELNFSLTHAPEVAVTNTLTGLRMSHSQTSWQLMYSWRY
ncbi:MAG TPA: aromatic hydrocarbon degradation protein, partial [Alphaproteobacteria bacterium]|nr:aromatic hydrocarbon degradation protein [Alphaproteobacteria bacterium]